MAHFDKGHSASMQENISELQAPNQPPDTQARDPVPTATSHGEPLRELPLPPLPAHPALATEETLQQLVVTMQTMVEQVQRVNDRLDAFAAQQPLQGSGTVERGGDNDGNDELANVLERVRQRRAERDMQQV
jgi:hypothetical protein